MSIGGTIILWDFVFLFSWKGMLVRIDQKIDCVKYKEILNEIETAAEIYLQLLLYSQG